MWLELGGPLALGGPLDFVHPCPMVVTPLATSMENVITYYNKKIHASPCIVNKDLIHKAKDLGHKAKGKAKDLKIGP